MMAIQLNKDPEMIERMELDLVEKAKTAFEAAGVTSNVFGVFSLDDLENKMEKALSMKVGIGVGYLDTRPVEIETNPRAGAVSGAVKTLNFKFLVILAVPTAEGCLERYTGTKLLSILRLSILGSTVAGDPVQRKWGFDREGPNVDASTDTMLYYSQVWQVALQNVGQLN